MPRLAPALILQAGSQNPHLAALLRVCRDLRSARNELRWLTEHAQQVVASRTHESLAISPALPKSDSDGYQPKGNDIGAAAGPAEPNNHNDPRLSQHGRRRRAHLRIVSTTPHVARPKIHYRKSLRINKILHGTPVKFQKEDQKSVEVRSTAVRLGVQDAGSQSAHARVLKEKEQEENDTNKREESSVEEHLPRIRRFETGTSDQGEQWFLRQRLLQKDHPEYQELTNRPEPSKVPRGRQKISLKHETIVDAKISVPISNKAPQKLEKVELARLVTARARGKPLQYIIGNQPFGNLDILCQKGVLIPRPETETYTEEIAKQISSFVHSQVAAKDSLLQASKQIRILDLCTGTGCIALLLHSLLKPPPGTKAMFPGLLAKGFDISIRGIDISPRAIQLATKNLNHNISKGLLHPDAKTDISFKQGDIIHISRTPGILKIPANANGNKDVKSQMKSKRAADSQWDVVVSNPPYISAEDYALKTEMSVRRHEPIQALVPQINLGESSSVRTSGSADQFYLPILRIANTVGAKMVAMEVGDTAQARRVLARVNQKISFNDPDRVVEVWRDDGSISRSFEVKKSDVYNIGTISPNESESSRSPDIPGSSRSSPVLEPRIIADEMEISSDRLVVGWRKNWGSWRREAGSEGLKIDITYLDSAPKMPSTKSETWVKSESLMVDAEKKRPKQDGTAGNGVKELSRVVSPAGDGESRLPPHAGVGYGNDKISKSIIQALLDSQKQQDPPVNDHRQVKKPRNEVNRKVTKRDERDPEAIISRWL